MELVSVIIPTYNRATLVPQTIDSVLAQTYPAVEVIVVDDGSTDGTAEMMDSRYRGRVTYLPQANQGESVARNHGIRVSRGEYLTFLDDDDLMYPDKIAQQVNYFQTHPDVGLVHCRFEHIDEMGRALNVIGLLPEGRVLRLLALNDFLWSGAPLIRRQWVEQVGGYDTTLPYGGMHGEDWHLWLQLALAGAVFGGVQQVLGAYRLTKIGQTSNVYRLETGNIAILDRLFAHPGLPDEVIAVKQQAYAHCYLLLCARYYAARQWDEAHRTYQEALHRCPDAAATEWSQRIADQALSYRLDDPVGYLDEVFAHLPPDSDHLVVYRGRLLGQLYGHRAFDLYFQGEIAAAQQCLRQAMQADPDLATPAGLSGLLLYKATHLPTPTPLVYLDTVFTHLPAGAEKLAKLRPRLISQVALAGAFEAYNNQQRGRTLRHILRAVRHQPTWVRNRGILAMTLRTLLHLPPRPYQGD